MSTWVAAPWLNITGLDVDIVTQLPWMRSLDSIFPRNHWSEMEVPAHSGHCVPLLSFVIHQLHGYTARAWLLPCRDHLSGYTKPIECKVYILACRTLVSGPIYVQIHLGRLKAPSSWRVNLQYILSLLIKGQKIVPICRGTFSLFF